MRLACALAAEHSIGCILHSPGARPVAQAFVWLYDKHQTHRINQVQLRGTTARRLRLGRSLQVPGNWPFWAGQESSEQEN